MLPLCVVAVMDGDRSLPSSVLVRVRLFVCGEFGRATSFGDHDIWCAMEYRAAHCRLVARQRLVLQKGALFGFRFMKRHREWPQ